MECTTSFSAPFHNIPTIMQWYSLDVRSSMNVCSSCSLMKRFCVSLCMSRYGILKEFWVPLYFVSQLVLGKIGMKSQFLCFVNHQLILHSDTKKVVVSRHMLYSSWVHFCVQTGKVVKSSCLKLHYRNLLFRKSSWMTCSVVWTEHK